MTEFRRMMMKKRLLTLLLAGCLAASSLLVPASAASGSDPALQTVQALGIMQGDRNGDLMLDSAVTRAQFVTMMTRASVYRDTIGSDGSGYSLFRDVKSSHWASEAIRLAIQEGWATGYIDGTFRPGRSITLEEACTMALRLLGYDSSSLAGSFPAAQLSKASSLGLRDQISLKQGELMTRGDCAQLFYNLLTAQTADGKTYAASLGYTLINGEVDLTSVLKNSLSGPYVADSGDSLPFTPTTIYRDDASSTSAALNQYDVYYYNEGLSTVWIYTNRVAGKVTKLSPGSASPTSVTVAGVEYEIGSSTAAYQLSVLGGGSTGAVVTLLLGMDDQVAGVVTGSDVEMMYYGVVQSSSRGTTSDGKAAVETTVTVVCTDGITRTFTVDYSASYITGRLVSVNVTDSGVTVKNLSERSVSGQVSSDAAKFGDYAFAASAKLLDTSDEGGAVTVTPQRLAGCDLSGSSVRYYALNEKGEIEHLILDNATGDTQTYAYMTSVDDQSTEASIQVSYEYLIDGTASSIRSSSTKYPVNLGGVGITYGSDGSIRSIQQLSMVHLTDLSGQSAMSSSKKYALADDVQVYLYQNGTYYLTTASAVNAEDYMLTGWYDTASSAAGGRIRILIAAGT